jgi:site-specific DNA recombinase
MSKNMDRLLIAYQEGLVSLEQLRSRMPELRKKDQAIQAELQSLETASADQTKYLRLVETLSNFNVRLRERATTLEVTERQKVLRLLVKEILVGRDTITIRHSIQIQNSRSDSGGAPGPPSPHQLLQQSMAQSDLYYLLRSGSRIAASGKHLHATVSSGMGDETVSREAGSTGDQLCR